MRALHDFVLHLDPEPHRETFLKPLHTGDSSAFCSSCHKVHLDVPVNQYRWLRGFNSYDNWQASGVSGEGARSFYYPDESMTCTDCHMPLTPGEDPAAPDGMLRSHRFAAANTALPTAYEDEKQLRAVKDFLQAGQVSVDLFALVRSEAATGGEAGPSGAQPLQLASTFAVGEEAEMALPARMAALPADEEVIAPLDRMLPAVAPGESFRLDAVVRTRNVGHFFPGGTVDAFDVWIELKIEDEDGRPVFWSGRVEDDGTGPVEPSAHFYRSLMLDGKGAPINKRNAWAARSVMYVQLIGPGSANTVRFRVRVPEDAGSELRVHAKLNYRKFAWWNTQFAYAGVRESSVPAAPEHDPAAWSFDGDLRAVSGPVKAIPDVPIVTMAEARVTLPVSRDGIPEPDAVQDAADALRWNDYGIGMLLQGDLRAAERAFLTVTELRPDYADGWVNVARVRIQEGDPDGAQAMLDEALAARSRSREEPLLLRAHAEDPGALRRGARALPPRGRALPAGSRRPQPDRPPSLPQARVRAGDRGAPEVASGGPRGPRSALQPHALVPGRGQRRPGGGASRALPALQGGRGLAVSHRRVPAREPRRQQRAPPRPRAPERPARGGKRRRAVRLTLASALTLVAAAAAAEVRFTDVTQEAGIAFVHENGAYGKKYLPETMGSGVAFFDADGDSDQDLLFVNGAPWPDSGSSAKPTAALYLNRGDGTFEDRTPGSGLDRSFYGMGVAVADYDADGDRDVYITALGPNLPLRQ